MEKRVGKEKISYEIFRVIRIRDDGELEKMERMIIKRCLGGEFKRIYREFMKNFMVFGLGIWVN